MEPILKTFSDGLENDKICVLLHGYGANGQDLFSLKQFLPPGWGMACPEAPLSLQNLFGFPGAYAWFPIDQRLWTPGSAADLSQVDPSLFQESREKLLKWFETLDKNKQICLGGFSQGSMMCYHLLPELMAQGYKIQWLSLFSTNPLSLNFVQNKLSDIADKMPVFISHGLQDPVLDHSKAMEVATLLETLDYKIQVHTFNGGHEISLDILQKWREFLGH